MSSFLERCFSNSLHDGFLQISTKSSYPISSRRRGACFTNLSQDERGSRRVVSRTVHHIPVVSALCGGTRNHQGQCDQQCHDFGGSPHVKLLLNCR
ncbi:hypothetical protein AVEN_47420-1 [Araneus ventricosus]|uniref:Uncharacterized protein n=1 Tax=Araneus ventricosus TaxID=182803 RepID=A0A4Y2KRK0_ARAVE|nr:hypothetical protein AVEN_47420-1 [Araneus ventricosus]